MSIKSLLTAWAWSYHKDLQYFDDRQYDLIDMAENALEERKQGAYYLYQFADMNVALLVHLCRVTTPILIVC